MIMKKTIQMLLIATLTASSSLGETAETRDVSWFLKRLRTVDHLPVLEDSHTAMVSTWDKEGANMDVWTHDNITGKTNTIVDIDGPGCMHRIFTGYVDERFSHSIIQIFLDGSDTPIIDMPIPEFFNDESGPFPYPLTFIKTYPGTLMPIPFEKNITIKIVCDRYETDEWIKGMWGVYWQFTYTTYQDNVPVRSLEWPLDVGAQAELKKTCAAWLKAESAPPAEPKKWTVREKRTLKPGEAIELNLKQTGIIKQMRIAAFPDIPEVLNQLRLKMTWDGHNAPSVDVPIGYLFGHGQVGHNKDLSSLGAVTGKRPVSGKEFLQDKPQPYNSNYNSLLLGMTDTETYCTFPMPFSNGAKIQLVNTGDTVAESVELKLDVQTLETLPTDWGRFHITWSQSLGGTEATPKFGKKDIPCKVFLDRRGKGKYVGTMLQIDWPREMWWGEGDWLFWTDEVEWPPSYHGTGSEEYFNSGWGMFDRKAISGFVATRPGFPTVYSFHLNDAFQFQENIKVAEEQWAFPEPDSTTNSVTIFNPMWSSTAFWYADKPMGAESPR